MSEHGGCEAKPYAELGGVSLNRSGHTSGLAGNLIVDSRSITVTVCQERAFEPIQRIGGANGWYYGNWLWRLRGLIDMAVGGPGMRPSRLHRDNLHIGDRIDFWKVIKYEPHRLLRLEALMKLPGRAWLEFEVAGERNASTIRQTAVFDPKGLFGLLYWYVLLPVHKRVFDGMLAAIGRAATDLEGPVLKAGPDNPQRET